MNTIVIKEIKSLKWQIFTPPGCKDIGIDKFYFVAKTQFFFNSMFKQKDPRNYLNITFCT